MAQPAASPTAAPPPTSQKERERTPRARLAKDRLARWVISASGLAIVLSILGILVFILAEIRPLLGSAEVKPLRQVALPSTLVGATLPDEHREAVALLTGDAKLVVVRTADGRQISSLNLFPTPATRLTAMAAQPESHLLAGATNDGRVVLVSVQFAVSFAGSERVVTPQVAPPVVLTLDPAGRPLSCFAGQLDGNGGALAAAQLADGTLAVVRRAVAKNEMSGETTESLDRQVVAVPERLAALRLDTEQKNLYAGTTQGGVLWWPLENAESAQPGTPGVASAGASPVTAITLLVGNRTLVVGQENGDLSAWFRVKQPDDSFRLERVRDFPSHPKAIRALAPAQRDKGFFALDASGRLGLYYSTSHRTMWTGPAPLAGGVSLAYAPKQDAVFLASADHLAEIAVHNPHPEISWQALFGKTWYEGYSEPRWVWQSTGGTDDFEPKLALTPLLFGTLKGTFYSLLLAIPLGVFGAMYTSQLMHPSFARYLKPMIEIMASLPSVVLGFLAGLWLAPRLENAIPALVVMVPLLPLMVIGAGRLWMLLPRTFRGRFHTGIEAIFFVGVLAAGIALAFRLAKPFEAVAFGGNFQAWLLKTTGLPFDQRNAIVVGLAMGFAVIPIIFAVSEDAFSNVPRNLVAGSLALGADRWQTVTRVVLPTASPGIFSGVMIGFGRAIGETMIVLMATGNTPIMDWNPFNGFRTLSANIAVEIPEAPHGGTLYRTLFLAALLLFVLTFVINTLAELVRQRLRERYSQL